MKSRRHGERGFRCYNNRSLYLRIELQTGRNHVFLTAASFLSQNAPPFAPLFAQCIIVYDVVTNRAFLFFCFISLRAAKLLDELRVLAKVRHRDGEPEERGPIA